MDTFAVPTDGGDLMTKQSIGLNYLRQLSRIHTKTVYLGTGKKPRDEQCATNELVPRLYGVDLILFEQSTVDKGETLKQKENKALNV